MEHVRSGHAVPQTSVSPQEIEHFDALAAGWWDPNGPMRPLHRMNPLRVGWMHARVGGPAHWLDVGCGAGLAAEALAKLGHVVTGVDAAAAAIAAGQAHAEGQGLRLQYRAGVAEDLLAEGLHFPVISALEVIEHVPNPAAFLVTLAELLEPGGKLFVSTLNRTRRSWLTAIAGAEYVLRLLPVGTHDWNKFLSPAELAATGRAAGLRLLEVSGMQPGPTGWRMTRTTAVNYIAALTR